MPKFRKKPVVIDAIRNVYENPEQWNTITRFLLGANWHLSNRGNGVIHIHTLEGVMQAMPGDWIIKGVKGEFYPCKPDIFEATYEPAE